MGRRAHKPRRGSLAYSPRVRAPREIPHVRSRIAESRPGLGGFMGYKAGMTHVFMIDDYKQSMTAGQEIAKPATVIEAPPVRVIGIRLYGSSSYGLNSMTDVWAKELPKELSRSIKLPKAYDFEKKLEKAERMIGEGVVKEIRLLVSTQPRLSGMPKKKPDVWEVNFGSGPIQERWSGCKEILGKEVRLEDVFKPGEYVDVIAITKGKGFQGPVKRWGIKILSRKQEGGHRQVGTLGPWKPTHVIWTVPQAGQMGYHQRTEFNKRILKIGEGKEFTPKGGFLKYGQAKSTSLLLAGSIPGAVKRPVYLRPASRAKVGKPTAPPSVTFVKLTSQQGK